MNVIDKILNEWSFRCHDGIVDMNDPKKVSILNEILKEYNLDEQEQNYTELGDEIKKALISLDYKDRKKTLEYIKNIKNKEEQSYKIFFKKIIPSLESRGLKRKEASNIFAEFVKEDKEEELIKFYSQLPKLSIEDLSSIKTPIYKIFDQLGCKECKNAIDNLYNTFAGSGGTKGIGKEENFLVAFYENVKKLEDKGDIEVDNQKYEVKGVGAIVSPFSRGDKEDVYPVLEKLIKLIEENIDETKYAIYEKDINNILTSKEKWVSSVVNLGNILFKDNIKKYAELLETSLREIYKGITLNDVLENGKINDNLVATNIAQYSIDNYKMSDSKEQFIFVSKNGEIKIIPTKEELKKLINNGSEGINITAFSDRAPRLTYKGSNIFATKEITEKNNNITLTEELTDYLVELIDPKDHFKQRINERGNVLDILNLNEIPLKDYNVAEVKEKLKSNISNEIKNRATKILEKESIPLSNLKEIGIKVLKPILISNGKEYSLKLFAKSITIAKDGSEIEKDNIGTLYFATIYNNKAATLLLLNKEDDNELYFQIKKHAKGKPGREDKEAEIITPPNYIYRIDLDELMGKEKSGPKLTDPTSLDYIPKAAYKPKSKFTSKSRGEGTIVAASVSGQRAGEPDGNGIVDWIDVEFKFDKPKLKSGKLIDSDIVRFNTVLTTSYKDFAK